MIPEQLLKHFEKISEAPDAIPRLRRFILDLAVRGKLVEQDPADEPAGELLKRLVRVNGGSTGALTYREEKPFPIPDSWVMIPFGLIFELIRGVTYDAADASIEPLAGYLPILRANNIGMKTKYDKLVYVKASRVRPADAHERRFFDRYVKRK